MLEEVLVQEVRNIQPLMNASAETSAVEDFDELALEEVDV